MIEDNNDLKYYLDEFIKYKKLASKLEDELIKNRKENADLMQNNNEMKYLLSQLYQKNNKLIIELILII